MYLLEKKKKSVVFRTRMRSVVILRVTVASADLECYNLYSVSIPKEWRDEEIWLGHENLAAVLTRR